MIVPSAASENSPYQQFDLAAEAKPNIMLIMADDFGYDCVTDNGGESYQTPNFDKLAIHAHPKELNRVFESATRGKAAKKKEE